MKRFIIALAMILALPLCAFAADGAKLGSVDVQKVLLMSDAGKEAKAELSQKADRWEADMKSKKAELDKLQKELESQGTVLTESARSAKERDYQQRLKESNRLKKAAEEDLMKANDDLTSRIVDDIFKVTQDYGRRNGYTTIFVRNDTMIYVDPAADLTDEILKAFNASRKK